MIKPMRWAPTMGAACVALCLAACGGGGNAGVGGTVSGLEVGQSVTLQDNDADSLTVSADGSFRFPTELGADTPYSVTVLTQPAGQICQVANGTGQVDSAADEVTGVAVACVTTASVGGTLSGLAPGTAVTLSNGTVLLPLAVNGPFAFPDVLTAGTAYDITVATQPLGQRCTVVNGIGTVSSGSLSALTVSCS